MDTIDDQVVVDGTIQQWLDIGAALPAATIRFANQLVVRHKMVGAGPSSTVLVYTGPPRPDGAIKIPTGTWSHKFAGFSLQREGMDRTGVGIGVGCDTTTPPNGSQVGGGLWEQVSVSGFDTGVKVGDIEGRAASEIEYHSLHVRECIVAIQMNAQNTLNHFFYNLGMMDCTFGLDSGNASGIHVEGGGCSRIYDCAVSLHLGGNSLKKFRAETSGGLLRCGRHTAVANVTVEGCTTEGMIYEHNEHGAADIYAKWGAQLRVVSSTFDGHVWYEPVDETGHPEGVGTIVLDMMYTRSDKLIETYPFEGVPGCQLHYDVRSCGLINRGGELMRRVAGQGVLRRGAYPKGGE